jgi:hypothetical protein
MRMDNLQIKKARPIRRPAGLSGVVLFMSVKVQLDRVTLGPHSDFAVIELNLTAVKGEAQRGLTLQLHILAADGKGQPVP